MQFVSIAIWVISLESPFTYATCFLIEFCQIVVTLWENHFIRPMIKMTYTSTHMLYFYSWKIASTSTHPSTNKTPRCAMFISLQSYHHNVWATQKEEIKDAYPKKVCHMLTRHVKKKRKREKMHTQRRYATCPQGMSKKRKKENIAHTKKNILQGRENSYKGVSSTIHQKYPQTCTSWSRLMTCFSFGSGLWLSNIWGTCMPPIVPLPSAPHKPF